MKYSKALTLKGAAAGLLLAALAGQAQAATFLDTYIGGTNPGGWVGQDVVGDSRFNIVSMDVTRDGNGLKVVINTNYSGAIVGAGGTTLGDLFLGQLANLSPTAFSNNLDTYVGDKDRFSHVFDFDAPPDTGASDDFWTNDAPDSQGPLVATLYTLQGGNDAGGDVLLSQNVESGGIRQNQAVDITEGAKLTAFKPATGTWSTAEGTVTFNIANFFTASTLGGLGGMYATGLTLGWGMTCANDYILAKVYFTSNGIPTNEVPIPAGLILLFSGLLGLGFLGRFKAKAAKARA